MSFSRKLNFFLELKVRFLSFSQKRQDKSAPIFFSGFRRKHLFVTTCIEKHCTGP